MPGGHGYYSAWQGGELVVDDGIEGEMTTRPRLVTQRVSLVVGAFLGPPALFLLVERLTDVFDSGTLGSLVWNAVRLTFILIVPLLLLVLYRRNSGSLFEPGQPVAEEARALRITVMIAGGGLAVWLVHSAVLAHFGSVYFRSTDADQFMGLGVLLGRELGLLSPVPLDIEAVGAPEGLSALLLDGYGPVWVLGLLTKFLSPVAGYNLLLCLATVTNYFGGARLAKALGTRTEGAILVGLAVATAPSLQLRYLGHVNLLWLAPTMLLAVEVLAQRDGRPRQVRVVLLFAVSLLISAYLFLISALIYGLVLLDRAEAPVKKVLRAHIPVALVLVLLATPLVGVRLAASPSGGLADAQVDRAVEDLTDISRLIYAADMGAMLVDNPMQQVAISESVGLLESSKPAHIEGWSLPGWTLVIGFIMAVAVIPRVGGKALIAYFLAGLLMWSPVPRFNDHYFLLGGRGGALNGWLPTTLLDRIPVLDGLRIPGRFALVLVVLFAALLARALAYLAAKGRGPLYVSSLVVLFALVLVTNRLDMPEGEVLYPDRLVDEIRDSLGDGDGDSSLLVVPNNCTGVEVQYALVAGLADAPVEGCAGPHLSLPLHALAARFRESAPHRLLSCTPTSFGRYATASAPEGVPLEAAMAELRQQWNVGGLLIDREVLAGQGCGDVSDLVSPLLADADAADRFVWVGLSTSG